MKKATIQNLEELRVFSLALKNRFSSTEKQKWTAMTVAAELVLQTTHLQYSLLPPNYKVLIHPTNDVDKGLKDELSDVLFNALNVLSFLDLTLLDIKETIELVDDRQSFNNMLVTNLIIQAANIWDNAARLEGYKHLDKKQVDVIIQIKHGISYVIQSVIFIAAQHKIDMVQAMTEMFTDAEKFLNKNKSNV